MKKFKFQLETLLKVTRRKKDDAELKFAEASRHLEACRAKLQELMRELQEGQEEFAEMTAEGKTVKVGVIMTYLKSIEQLKEKRRNEYNAEVLAEEQKMLDEIGLQLHMRRD